MSKREPLHPMGKFALGLVTVCYVALLIRYEAFSSVIFVIAALIGLFAVLDPDGLLSNKFGDVFGAEPRLNAKKINLRKRHPKKGGPDRHPW